MIICVHTIRKASYNTVQSTLADLAHILVWKDCFFKHIYFYKLCFNLATCCFITLGSFPVHCPTGTAQWCEAGQSYSQ